MTHGVAERLHHEEEHIRAVLQSTLMQYGVLLGMLLLLIVLGISIAYFQP